MKTKKTKNRIKMRKASKVIPRGRAPDPNKDKSSKHITMLPRVSKKKSKY